MHERIADEQHQRGRQRRRNQGMRATGLVGHVSNDRGGQDLRQERRGDDHADHRGVQATAGEPKRKKGDADALQTVIQEVEPVQRNGALSGVGIAAHSDE
ncbi:hypothetical protein D3C72_1369250 [compost metagenome]